MSQVNKVLFNLLDSHDVGRVYSRCNNEDVFFQQLAILVTMPGTPCIYYGTEIAMDGSCEPYNRKTMPWGEIDCGKYDSIIAEVKALIGVRRTYSALRQSEIRWRKTENRLICYERPGDVIIEVYINAGVDHEQIDLCGQEIVYARGYAGNVLVPGGTLIVRRNS